MVQLHNFATRWRQNIGFTRLFCVAAPVYDLNASLLITTSFVSFYFFDTPFFRLGVCHQLSPLWIIFRATCLLDCCPPRPRQEVVALTQTQLIHHHIFSPSRSQLCPLALLQCVSDCFPSEGANSCAQKDLSPATAPFWPQQECYLSLSSVLLGSVLLFCLLEGVL